MEEYDTKVVQVTSDIRFGAQRRRGRSRLASRGGANRPGRIMAAPIADCLRRQDYPGSGTLSRVQVKGYFLGWVAMIWSLILLYVALGRMPLETS
jgi:hypothetical protein